jgi:hypothetical protein
MFVCCECRVLSGRGLCNELITRPEKSYRLWCVVVCDLENFNNEEAMTCVGSQGHKKNLSLQSCLVSQVYVPLVFFNLRNGSPILCFLFCKLYQFIS